MQEQSLLNIDKNHIWHPYSRINSDAPMFAVERADGVEITLKNGKRLIDGMSSWWATLHGYNHPKLNQAAKDQLDKMSHIMFGGFTHDPAGELASRLVKLLPQGLDKIFFADSGSVAVEVAMKMAIQYQQARGESERYKFATIRLATTATLGTQCRCAIRSRVCTAYLRKACPCSISSHSLKPLLMDNGKRQIFSRSKIYWQKRAVKLLP